eukprot:TRINITY_DN586_c0_g1_i1.p1 TRINITY_DN586_c0_g1~~TRINITY_DN586_c0_g1_i1.p1  ORF type:complete len:198 (+),score=13.71 TRINITY_DN586_c0_g1_i1:428-1021(+)
MEAADNDQKKLWKSLTEITGYKELDREDTTEISAQSLADMLKAHMSSPQPPMESAHPAPETTTGPSFEIQQVSVEAVKIALQNIDTNKATGIDLIPPRPLPYAASMVATPLCQTLSIHPSNYSASRGCGEGLTCSLYTRTRAARVTPRCTALLASSVQQCWYANGWWARSCATFLRTTATLMTGSMDSGAEETPVSQ